MMIMQQLLTNHIFLDKMTVEKLIKILEQCPRDAEVKFWGGFEPAHELGAMDFNVKENTLYINDAECLDSDDYIQLEE